VSDDSAFLAALEANPADDTARLVYADWLDDHNEPRKAEYLRLVAALAGAAPDLTALDFEVRRMLALAEVLPDEWRATAGCRFAVVFHGSRSPVDKGKAMKLIATVSVGGFGQAKSQFENPPGTLHACVPFELAEGVRDRITREMSPLEIRIHASHQVPPGVPDRYQIVATVRTWECQRPADTVHREARAALARFFTAVTGRAVEDSALAREVIIAAGLEWCLAHQRMAKIRPLLPKNDYTTGWAMWIEPRRVARS
jgi:uncharacterized protein (TIGR02996 family)